MIFCPICSAEVRRDASANGDAMECSADWNHNLETDTPEFRRDHPYPAKGCPGCAAERAEDMGP